MHIRNYKLVTTLLPVAFVISVFVLFFLVSVSYKRIDSLTDSEKWVVHSHLVHIELQQMYSAIQEAESGQRGYLLTHDWVFLRPYFAGLKNADESYNKLKTLTDDNDAQRVNLDSLHRLINERFILLTSLIDLKNHEKPIPDLIEKKLTTGKALMDRIRQQKDNMIAVELKLLRERENEHKQEIWLSPLSYLLTAFFAILIFLLAYYKIKKDVNDLRKVNNTLLITHETFEHAEEIAGISNWCWNIEANTLSYSDNQYRLLGCKPNEFAPTIENYLKYVHPDDRHIIEEGGRRALLESVPSIAYFRVIRKDGKLRHFRSTGKIILDNYGKKILIGINADITDQYLKDKILEEKIFDLERSNNELSAFNHVASHDLQEPLRKIQTFISRITDTETDAFTDKGKEYFSRIQVAANRMQKLIDDLLSYSRANKADKKLEMIDLNIVLENSQQELAQVIEEKNAIIQSSLLPTLPVIPFQIQQLFNNLIGNSLKYSRPGVAPVITIKSEIVAGKELPYPSYTGENNFYKISIADNGIGFEQQYAETIFTLFHRLHNDNTFTGTGIGLTICKKIVENHKGLITAKGNPGAGSTFTIFLPA